MNATVFGSTWLIFRSSHADLATGLAQKLAQNGKTGIWAWAGVGHFGFWIGHEGDVGGALGNVRFALQFRSFAHVTCFPHSGCPI